MVVCTACQSSAMTVLDGIMYCDHCGTQVEHYTEYEVEDFLDGFKKLKSRKDEGPPVVLTQEQIDLEKTLVTTERDRDTRKRKPNEQLVSQEYQELMDDQTVTALDEPYLKSTRGRLSLFVKAVMKCAVMMKVELDYPEEFPEQCYHLVQRYLSHCGIAFSAVEYTEDYDKMLRCNAVNKDWLKEKKQSEREKKVAKKAKGKAKLSQSQNVFLTLSQLGDDLEELDSDEDDGDLEEGREGPSSQNAGLIKIIETNVSKKSFLMLERIILNADIIAAVLYISAITLGCSWTLLSDITRWIRENRAGLSAKMMRNIQSSQKIYSETGIAKSMKGRQSVRQYLPVPLSENMRFTLWLWQSLEIPTGFSIDITQNLSRILFNLNLPSLMIEQILVLMAIAPISDVFDSVALFQQGNCKEGTTCKEMYRCIEVARLAISQCFGRPRKKNLFDHDIFFSPETKIMAYILLALKLTFGMDDEREFIEQKTDDPDPFNVVNWLYQLKMRLMVWEGYDIPDVLQQVRPVYPLFPEQPFGDDRNIVLDRNGIAVSLCHQRLYSGFRECVPHCYSWYKDKTTNIFASFTNNRSFERNEDHAVYACLRHQPSVVQHFLSLDRTDEQRKQLNAEIDQDALKVFKKDYSSSELLPEKPEVLNVKNPESFVITATTMERCRSETERERWHSLFPCAKAYIVNANLDKGARAFHLERIERYPRPLWSHGTIYSCSSKNDDKENQKGLKRLYANRQGAQDAFVAAEPAMSRNFRFLLKTCAKVIGEKDVVLYAAFMMLEYQLLCKTEYKELRRKLCSKEAIEIPTLIIEDVNNGQMSTHASLTAYGDVDDPRSIQMYVCELSNLAADLSTFDLDADSEDESNGESESECISESEQSSDDEDVDQISSSSAKRRPTPSVVTPSSVASATLSENDDVGIKACQIRQTKKATKKFAFHFDTIWQLISLKYW